MIYDRQGDITKASYFYQKSLDKFKKDRYGNIIKGPQYMKVMTNYAVTLEKLGKREEAINILKDLQSSY